MSQSQDNEPWGQLIPTQHFNHPIELNQRSFSIGRHQDSDLCLDDVRVSSTHCRLYRARPGDYLLQDLSSNGTYLNNQKIGKNQLQRVKPGDIIHIVHESRIDDDGFISFIFSISEPEAQKYKQAKEEDRKTVWAKLNFFNCDIEKEDLYRKSYTIGRSPDCDIIIEDVRLSR